MLGHVVEQHRYRVAVAFDRSRNGGKQSSRILIREIRADGTLGKLRRSLRGNHVAEPDLESDAGGRLFAVWQRRGRGQTKIQVSRLSARAKVRRTTVAGVGVDPDLVISGGGMLLVSWRFGDAFAPERSPLAVSVRR